MTEIGRYSAKLQFYQCIFDFFSLTKTIPQGAATTFCMLLDRLPEAGTEKLYYADCVPAKAGKNFFAKIAADSKKADQLWDLSEKYVERYLSLKDSIYS